MRVLMQLISHMVAPPASLGSMKFNWIQPVTFPVKGVIAGWTEALQLMNVGSKYHLFIPSNLAYGERGAGQQIGPNATLIFEVELLAIEK